MSVGVIIEHRVRPGSRDAAYAAYVAAVEGLLQGPPTVTRTDILWTKPTT